MREPRRRSVGRARRIATTCTPSPGRRSAAALGSSAWRSRRTVARSRLSATSRSASSRSVARFSSLEEVLQRPGHLVRSRRSSPPQPLVAGPPPRGPGSPPGRRVFRKLSGMVSRTATPVARSTRSLRLSRCCTLKAPMTLMPASSSSLHVLVALAVAAARGRWCGPARRPRRPAACARAPRRGPSPPRRTPRYSTPRRGTTSSPSTSACGLRAAVRLDEAQHHVHARACGARAPPRACGRSCPTPAAKPM